ncbi:hypothetical protein JJL45_09095 [Tamlana sp. s12]|uniref:hypothetical protein n=1 Tax=Tamlana sp. s12 TaxID=1630406 RepID=UPI00080190BB|nr:hypothetical protein [Tamlana sp. s12]OBQ52888.1 hypothetical protein VQ01_13145 [Tamlana sp. s12]QQY81085.1 hypothetical protein JJL45_09095 [Tamlana sp. s12]
MLKRLKNFLNLFKLFNSKNKNQKISLPNKISGTESIIRAVYSPINLHKNGKKLNNSFYKPKAGEDEISVNRLDFTTPIFLKKLAKIFENTSERRSYFGFSLLKASEIEDSGLRTVYSPLAKPVENPYHADIKIDYVVEKGVQLPSEISYKIKNITVKSRFYSDPNPESKEWNGNELI